MRMCHTYTHRYIHSHRLLRKKMAARAGAQCGYGDDGAWCCKCVHIKTPNAFNALKLANAHKHIRTH